MKKKLILLLALLLFVCFSFGGLAACKAPEGDDDDITLPSYPEDPDDGQDSWLNNDGSQIKINWFVNYSWFSYPESGLDEISKVIKEKTGITIEFNSPIDDSGQMLSTLIAGDALPDVVTIQQWYPQTTQLALEGYVYPIDELANRWAKSLNGRIEDDIRAYYSLNDGHIYGLPGAAYSSKYVKPEDKWAPNGAMLVREDCLNWYESQPNAMDVSTPQGLKDAIKKVKAQYGSAANNPVKNPLLIDQFTNDGNPSVTWLSQYYAAPFENAQGNRIDQRETAQYKEALTFLNDCHKAGYISTGNYSANASAISQAIATGSAFVSLVTPQNYPSAFINAYNNGIRYVPIVSRNAAGDDPILQDLTGNGFTLSMITKKAKRPD